MSKEELLDAYVEGRISRRSFIRGLTAIGISLSSAVLHAAALRPGSTALADDLYDDGNHHQDKDKDRKPVVVDTGSDIASAGNGGVTTASADGGTVVIGDVNSGGNAGNAIGVGDTYGDVPVDFELLYEVAALVNQSRDQAIRAPSCFDLCVKRLP